MLQRTVPDLRFRLVFSAFLTAASLTVPAAVEAFEDRQRAGGDDSTTGDPFALPAGDSAELLKFVNKIMSVRKRFRSVREVRAYLVKINFAVEQAVGKILADDSADDATVAKAVAARFAMLSRSMRYDRTALKATADFLKSLESDSRPGVVAEVEKQSLLIRVRGVARMSDLEKERLIEDVDGWLEKNELGRSQLMIAQMLALGLETPGRMELAAMAYTRFAARFQLSEDPEIALHGDKFEGAARRVKLVGNPIEVTGTTLAGEKFDWSPYKGKVVLVDFWATWCVPCIRELPNIKKNYALYHDRGFEVVGISLDTKLERVEGFLKKYEVPWVTLYGENEKSRGWDHPLAVQYGISSLPNVLLVDRQGNVVSLSARGPELGRLLEKLLGSPDTDAKGASLEKPGSGSER